jgi:hypothetical protein
VSVVAGVSRRLIVTAALGFWIGGLGTSFAADMALPAAPPLTPVEPPSAWTYRLTPYAWITALNGTSTVKGRTVDVDASFIDILEKSDSIFALMAYFEARNDRIALFADLVYSKIGFDGSMARSRGVAPGVGGTLGASLGLDLQMAIAEMGAAYEIARWNGVGSPAAPGIPASFTAIDVMAGVRYWWQKVDLDLSLVGTVNLGDLTIVGTRAIAKSGAVDWLDPFVGFRIRHQFAPGKELLFTADIGGFGAGSDISWQLVGAYTWEFAKTQNVTWAGVIGYRALYVDYAQGSGLTRYEYKMLEHGPLLGISMRF